MFQMRVINVVDSLVNTLLVKQPDLSQGKAVLFELDLKLASIEGFTTFNSCASLHLLYNKMHPHGSYISVFSYEGQVSNIVFNDRLSKEDTIDLLRKKAKQIDPRDRGYIWKHECTHDEGWKGLSLVSDIYFRCAREVNGQRKAAGHKCVPPRDMHDYSGPMLFSPAFRLVNVEQTLLPRGSSHRDEYSIKIL